MAIFRKLLKWAAIGLAVSFVTGCGGSSDSSCSGTIVYSAYSYAGAPSGEIGIAYTYTPSIGVSGCRPSDRVSAGSLPPGLSLDPGTGRITGVPTQGGAYSLTISPNAGGNVQSTFTINILPLGPQVPALTARRLATATDLPSSVTNVAMAIAAVDHGAGWVLYATDPRSYVPAQVYASTDMGAHWAAVPQAGGPGTRNGELRMASGSRNLYVLDTGGSNAAPTLYRYDGAAWHVVNNALPFAAVSGAGFHVDENDAMLVGWMGSQVSLWRSADQGVTWSQSMATAARSPTSSNPSACVGPAGADARMILADGFGGSYLNAAIDLKLGSGASAWTDYYFWQMPNGMTTRGTDLAVSCVSVRSRFWIATTAEPYPIPAYLAMSGAGAGSDALDFPRRVPDAPAMNAIGRMGSNIVGLTRYSWGSPWEVWLLE